MTNLTSATPRTFRGPRESIVMQAGAGVPVFAGSAVESNVNGQAANLTGAGTSFAGFLLQSASVLNENVEIAGRGTVKLTVAKATNWALTDHQATVYASDGNAFTLTSTSNQAIGKVVEIESGVGTTTAVVWVYFEGVALRSL